MKYHLLIYLLICCIYSSIAQSLVVPIVTQEQSIAAPSITAFQGSSKSLIYAGGSINNSYQSGSKYISHGNIFILGSSLCPYTIPTLFLKNDVEVSVETIGQSYQWFINDEIIPGATNSNLLATKSGNYFVAVTLNDQCPKIISQKITINILSSEEEKIFKIFPNPGIKEIKIEFPPQFDSLGSLLISNLLGQEYLFQDNISSGQFVDIQHLTSGTYQIILKSKRDLNKSHTFKFIKSY